MDIDDVLLTKVMLASFGACALLAWCVLVLRHGTVGSGVELHRPGCDRCCPTRASSSACPDDRDSGVFREQGVCGVCGGAVAAAVGAVGLVWTVHEMACFLTSCPL